MGIEKNPLAKPCRGCAFLGRNLGNCDYWLLMDKMRPCKPGKDCTVKAAKLPEGATRKANWDVDRGKKLWEKGATDKEIARSLHVSLETLREYRIKHWGKANHSNQATWDTEKAFQMYKAGATDREIYEELGIKKNTFVAYRKRQWGNANPAAITNWDMNKGLALRKKGMSYKQIAEALGTTETAVEQYSRRHWRGRK